MTRPFWLVILLFIASNVFADGGAITLVQRTGTGQATATNPTSTFPSAQAAGDANIVIVEYCGQPGGNGDNPGCGTTAEPGPVASVTDTMGNLYTRNCGPLTTISGGSYNDSCGGGNPTSDHQVTTIEVWSALNTKSAPAGNVVTMHMTTVANVTGWNIWMFQLHPASGTMIFDQSVHTQTGTISNPQAGPISTGTTATTSDANEFFFAFCNTSNGTCPQPLDSGWTEQGLGFSNGQFFDTHSDAAFRVVSSQQTASESFTAGSGENVWLGVLVTFGSAVSAPPAAPTGLTATVQ